jgi:hypothetical protein
MANEGIEWIHTIIEQSGSVLGSSSSLARYA